MADFLSRRDVDFLLYEWLDVVELTKRDHFAEHSRDTFDAVLDLSADIATKCFAPHNKKGDQNGPTVGPDGKVVLIDEIKHALDTLQRSGSAGRIVRRSGRRHAVADGGGAGVTRRSSGPPTPAPPRTPS